MQPSVWIVGDSRQAEFAAAIEWLREAACCTSLDGPAEASGKVSEEPGAILFLESRPGQFCPAEVERLHGSFPLARLVALVGPWCEGPQRTSGRLKGVSRIRWCDWENRLARALGMAGGPSSSAAPLPRTTTPAERIERDVAEVNSFNGGGRRVAIYTTSRANYQAVADAAERLGFAAFWQSEQSETQIPACDIIIHDGWDQTDVPTAAPRLLMLPFPRPEDLSRAAKLGISVVVAQPMMLSDLATALDGM